MIKLVGVNKLFYTKEIETKALSEINISIRQGDLISIMGPSGCGKSTLLHVMGLLDSPSTGEVEIDGTNIARLKDRELAKLRNQKIGFIFQNFHLIPSLNIIDNVELPLLYRGNMSRKERFSRVISVLEKVGLSHRMKHFPNQLSGGQSQRVALARAIVGNPDIILADEPTGNLDSRMSGEIMDLLVALNKEGTTIVIVTHDQEVANRTNNTLRMLDGKLIKI